MMMVNLSCEVRQLPGRELPTAEWWLF